MQSFLLALQFLTRLPVPVRWDDRQAGRSLLYYPLVGLLIGLALLLVAQLGDSLLAAVLAVTAWVLLSGALHIDGLADSADAWLGGHGDRERTLAIMKDPSCGPMGVVAIVLVLGLKIAAVGELLSGGSAVLILLAPVLARALVIVLFLSTPYVRPQGLGQVLADHLPRERARIVVGVSAAFALLFGWSGFSALIAALVAFWLLRALMLKRLGGSTGDTTGAMIEIAEAAVVVALAI
jgi:adenosylcobinamide-GDP ribazoletransferase